MQVNSGVMFHGKKEIMSPNPFYQPVYFDSCAFDGGDELEQQASIEARELFEENGGNINIVHSVMKEIEYPNTQCVTPPAFGSSRLSSEALEI